MAIYHLHVNIVSRKTGRSAVAAAAYRAADRLTNEYDNITHDYTNRSSVSAAAYRAGEQLTNEQGQTHDFSNKRGVVHTEIMLPENAPLEFKDRKTLWNAVEKSEKRCDAQTARDIDVALPIEFDRKEQIEVLREYIQDNFVDKGMIADFAIHDKQDGNPHAHILLTTRKVSENGFEGKERDWNKKSHLKSWRDNWANACNEKLKAKELDERIDHRTLKAQGIDREPTIHVGVSAKHMESRGLESDRARKNREIIERNQAKSIENTAKHIHELKEGYVILDKKITELKDIADDAKHEINVLRAKAEKITERVGQINAMSEKLDELRAERQEMGLFKNKNVIDQQIQRLERSYEQANSFFKQRYNITPEQSAEKVGQLEYSRKSKEHLHEKLLDKLAPLVEEKEEFALEYGRQKLLLEVCTDSEKIQDKLKQLNKESSQSQTPKDRLARERSERELNKITDRNFKEIIKELQPEQAETLIKRREHEREWERTIIYERGR